jgi:hypothetical protein
MAWLDREWPAYRQGRNFNLMVMEIPAELIRECV